MMYRLVVQDTVVMKLYVFDILQAVTTTNSVDSFNLEVTNCHSSRESHDIFMVLCTKMPKTSEVNSTFLLKTCYTVYYV